MVAEVCSIYLRRAGKMLELFATEGLNRAAVHNTAVHFPASNIFHSQFNQAVRQKDSVAAMHFFGKRQKRSVYPC